MMQSHSLVFSDFDTYWYKRWARELKQNKQNLDSHQLKANKFWQNAVIAQALFERGKIKKGNTGIGFGVGKERLPALFAKYGVLITATDQDFTTEKALHWEKHELAKGLDSLNRLGICPSKKFEKTVQYAAVDMSKIPNKFNQQYDFVWSNCALGHLGSIEAGLKFIIESAKCLKPGGVAVHTTEINVISNSITLDNHPETVIFRPRDFYKLSKQLKKEGFTLSHLKLNFGDTKKDASILMLPKFGNDYSKLQVGGHIITQIVLILQHTGKKNLSTLHRCRNYTEYKRNRVRQLSYARKSTFLKEIRDAEKVDLSNGDIVPARSSYDVTLSGTPAYLYLKFYNNSRHPLFSIHNRLHTTSPLTLATTQPQDRKSKFMADDWFNNKSNRPSPSLYHKRGKKWEELDYIRPRSDFAFRLKLDPNKIKPGKYTESFVLIQEGVKPFPDTKVSVNIVVS